jgi:hypothetical protein
MIINLTPHPINICDAEGSIVKTIPVSGWEFRLATSTISAGQKGFSPEIEGIPLTVTEFGEPELVPSKNNSGQEKPVLVSGNLYVVSQLIKNLPEMVNNLSYAVPAQVVRDAQGNIVGCKSLGI